MGSLQELGIDLDSMTDPKIKQAMVLLFNLIEDLSSQNTTLREENQKLRNEIALLKGEQGKPDIQGKNQKQAGDISSEQERREPGKERRKKSSKNEHLEITRTEVIQADTTQLPQDAQFKGYETVIVQDLVVRAEVIAFKKAVYYSPSLKKTFTADLPGGYQGTFGPHVKALIILLKTVGNMTEPKIAELLTSFSLLISPASIDRILTHRKEHFHQEKEEIFQAGLQSSSYQHIDDTSCRVNGENRSTQIVCNPWYSAYFTREKKDRLTILEILSGKLTYLFNQETATLLTLLRISPKLQKKLLAGIPKETVLSKEHITKFLEPYHLNALQTTRILEAAAISSYHAQTGQPIIELLMADDAPQFKHLTKELALCWVHDGRHYKKLHPVIASHREILTSFLTHYWEFYRKLLAYKAGPTPVLAFSLSEAFDLLFSTHTDYWELNERIAKTKAKKAQLLLVLQHPELPLHNNPAELAARAQVRKRDVSLQTRTPEGTKVQDTFLTIVETAKKLKVKLYDYIFDRITETYSLPSLARLLLDKSVAQNTALVALP